MKNAEAQTTERLCAQHGPCTRECWACVEIERLDSVIAYLELKRGMWTAELMEARDDAIARFRARSAETHG